MLTRVTPQTGLINTPNNLHRVQTLPKMKFHHCLPRATFQIPNGPWRDPCDLQVGVTVRSTVPFIIYIRTHMYTDRK